MSDHQPKPNTPSWAQQPPAQHTGWVTPPLAPRPPKKKGRGWKIAGGVVGGIIVLSVIGAITGGGKKNDDKPAAAPAATATSTTQADTATQPAAAPSTKAPVAPAPKPKPPAAKTVPALVGKGLQAAQDAAQAEGFYNLTSHDSAGRDRMQLLDRDWKVCSQAPKAGTSAPTDTKLDLGAVKVDETCPARDQKPPAKAGAVMPNFVGKGLNTATEALPSDLSITPTDASGQGRMIIVESNWKVCSQKPSAGTPLSGQPVSFMAVKFGESCP